MEKRKIVTKLQIRFSFPQVKLFCAIALLTVVALFAAVVIQDAFWSSIASNVFAGLIDRACVSATLRYATNLSGTSRRIIELA